MAEQVLVVVATQVAAAGAAQLLDAASHPGPLGDTIPQPLPTQAASLPACLPMEVPTLQDASNVALPPF